MKDPIEPASLQLDPVQIRNTCEESKHFCNSYNDSRYANDGRRIPSIGAYFLTDLPVRAGGFGAWHGTRRDLPPTARGLAHRRTT